MENTQIGKEGLIEKLRAMQFAETAKPSDRMDADLVDVLTDMLLDLDDISPCKQTEQDTGIKSILKTIGQHPANMRRKRSLRRILIAAIIAALILAAGLVYLTLGSQGSPDQFKWAHYIVEHVLPGKSIATSSKITIYHNGVYKKYETIEECLNAEHYQVFYPNKLPANHYVTAIQVISDAATNITRIQYITDCPEAISIAVFMNSKVPSDAQNNADLVEKKEGIVYYYVTEEGWCQCNYSIANNLYKIDAPSYFDVQLIIANMKGIE
jgi:hypothetical protein